MLLFQVLEQRVLRAEAGSAQCLQRHQELWAGTDVPRRGASVPQGRHLGDPQQLQEEEARCQTAVGLPAKSFRRMRQGPVLLVENDLQ